MRYQIQIFYGRCPPHSIEPRTLAVVWDGDRIVDKGSPKKMRELYPGAVQRKEPEVWLDLSSLRDFNPVIGNPLHLT